MCGRCGLIWVAGQGVRSAVWRATQATSNTAMLPKRPAAPLHSYANRSMTADWYKPLWECKKAPLPGLSLKLTRNTDMMIALRGFFKSVEVVLGREVQAAHIACLVS